MEKKLYALYVPMARCEETPKDAPPLLFLYALW